MRIARRAPGGRIAANNKLTFDLLLAQAKAPGESRYPWDYLQVLSRIPAESGCPLVKP